MIYLASFFEKISIGDISVSDLSQAVVSLVAILGSVLIFYRGYITRGNQKEITSAFKETIQGLSSNSVEVRMSSAILLRRFFDKNSEYGVGGTCFAKTTINVISAVLKTLPTNDFQKVLADTLRFSPDGDLKSADFQGANLSKAFLANIDMKGADFFQANLSGTSLRDANLDETIFYESILIGTKLNGAKLRGANFTSAMLEKVDFKKADLSKARFENAFLKNVDFTGANLTDVCFNNAYGYGNKGCPDIINQFKSTPNLNSNIFISKPGVLDVRQNHFVQNVIELIDSFGLSALEYNRSDYSNTNALSKIAKKIHSCSAFIAFGFKSIHINDGVFRYSTKDERIIKQEFLSTPWNQVEIGIAIAMKKPILLLVDNNINDGAFDIQIIDELVTRMEIKSCLETKNNNVSSWIKLIFVCK